EKVFKFVHLPVQSGSNRILREMRRGYSVEDYLHIVQSFRKVFPRITVSTDIIVGFPTETESEFEESLKLIRSSKPDIVNLSRFGARSGTEAAEMQGQISNSVAKIRSEKMNMTVKEIQNEVNSRWIGWRGPVLIDEIVKNAVVGRNFA